MHEVKTQTDGKDKQEAGIEDKAIPVKQKGAVDNFLGIGGKYRVKDTHSKEDQRIIPRQVKKGSRC